MRRPLLAVAVVFGSTFAAPGFRADAQIIGPADPFTFYYGYYLPNQAALATRATPMDTINQVQAARQQSQIDADRAAIYNLTSPFDEDELRPFGRRGGERVAPPHRFPANIQQARGARLGRAQIYFHRPTRYYAPVQNQHSNKNLAATRRGGGMGAMGGMGGMGMPGPR